jgi:hypothetical protein
MTTQEVVDRWLVLVKEGKNVQAEEELYHENILSVEQNGHQAIGLAPVIEKTKGAFQGIETFHGGGVSAAYVAADSFLLKFDMDMTPKGGERMQMTEYGFYKVADGKVTEEYFFAQPMSM